MNQAAHVTTMPEIYEEEIEIKQSVQELVATAGQIVVMSRQDLSEATDVLKRIKTRIKTAEEQRVEITKPINEGLRALNARFKATLEPLVEAGEKLGSKMLRFQQQEEAKAREEAARLEKIRQEKEKKEREEAEVARKLEEAAILENSGGDLDRAEPPKPVAPVPVAAPVQSTFKASTYGQQGAVSTIKKVWTFDIVELAAVPVEFMVIDQTKINQAIRAGAREIPGLRIYQKDSLQVR